jgi:putative ATP-binding cassette transporter
VIALLRLLYSTSRRTLPFAVVLGIASGVAMTGLLALMSYGIEHRKDPQAILAYAVAAVLLLTTRFLSKRSVVHLSERALADFRKRTVRTVLEAPLRTLETLGDAKLLSALTDDMLVLSAGLTALHGVLVDLVVIVACLVYLALLSLKMTGLLLGFIVFGGLTFQIASASAGRDLGRARDAQDQLFEALQGAVAGAKELKLSEPRRTAFLRHDLDQVADKFQVLQARGRTSYDGSALWGFAVLLIAIGVSLFLSSKGMTAQALAAYVLTTIYMNSALDNVFGTLPAVARAEVILTRLNDLGFALSPAANPVVEAAPTSMNNVNISVAEAVVLEDDAPIPSHVKWRRIELSNICHSYSVEGDARPFGLDRINLTLTPGKITFLIGGNGSGKSTLVKVLVGLYLPESGTISVDGVVINDANRDTYRENFSAVFADYHLFKRLPAAPTPELLKRTEVFLKKLKLAHKVSIVDGAFSTTSLSSGQRKRLALVAAYLEDRHVYVFDEWTSDQDPMFRDYFYTEILPDLARRGKAIVCVTHDEKYFGAAHKRIKLDGGRIDLGDTSMFLQRLTLPPESTRTGSR